MKLYVLSENSASPGFLAEHGLSYYIEFNNKKLLFDTGASDVFMKNALKLNVNLQEIDLIVLSHGHWDHGNGLKFIKNKPLTVHPDAFIKRYRKSGKENIGIDLSLNEIINKFSVNFASKPFYINENIIFLGEIPHTFEFEERETAYYKENGDNDDIKDDSALVLIKNNELIVVSGCAHSGICNIIEYSKELTGISKINTVIGGFHLKKQNYQTKKTIEYFNDNAVKNILPSHCTELPALSMFFNEFKIKHVKSGMIFNF
jgi:7,8-dihydropterin-6-yl-methyl-4-(beta-D-ribofuranosyl)aminobenzene 5'-phosphate synthase